MLGRVSSGVTTCTAMTSRVLLLSTTTVVRPICTPTGATDPWSLFLPGEAETQALQNSFNNLYLSFNGGKRNPPLWPCLCISDSVPENMKEHHLDMLTRSKVWFSSGWKTHTRKSSCDHFLIWFADLLNFYQASDPLLWCTGQVFFPSAHLFEWIL